MKKEDILRLIYEEFGIPYKAFENYEFEINKDAIWILSEDLKDKEIPWLQRKGFRFGNILKGGRVRISFFAAQLFGRYATKRIVELKDDEVELYIRGLDIENRWEVDRGQVLVSYQGFVIGVGVITENKLKPQVPLAKRVRSKVE